MTNQNSKRRQVFYRSVAAPATRLTRIQRGPIARLQPEKVGKKTSKIKLS